jgi:hypothetical protein
MLLFCARLLVTFLGFYQYFFIQLNSSAMLCNRILKTPRGVRRQLEEYIEYILFVLFKFAAVNIFDSDLLNISIAQVLSLESLVYKQTSKAYWNYYHSLGNNSWQAFFRSIGVFYSSWGLLDFWASHENFNRFAIFTIVWMVGRGFRTILFLTTLWCESIKFPLTLMRLLSTTENPSVLWPFRNESFAEKFLRFLWWNSLSHDRSSCLSGYLLHIVVVHRSLLNSLS